MKKVLIFGASGFVGRHIVPYLENKNVDVTPLSSKEVNLNIQEDLKNIPQKDYDHIFHLAAWTQAGDFCDKRRGEQWIINQQINTNILSWWKDNCPKAKMIAFGTSVSYTTQELKEKNYLEGIPYDKYYAYAMSKRMLLAGLECLHKQFGMQYVYCIPSTVYGPKYHTDGRQLHFIYDIIRKIYLGKQKNTPVVLFGDGYQRRELIYIDDFISLLLEITNKGNNDVYNLGGGIDYSIRDFAQMICEEIGYSDSKIKYDTNQFVGSKSKILNIEKAISLTDYSFKYSLKEGLQKTIQWMIDETNMCS